MDLGVVLIPVCVNSDDVYTSGVNSGVGEPGILLTPAPGLAQPTEFYHDDF